MTKTMNEDVLEFLRSFLAGGSQQDFKPWASELYQKLYRVDAEKPPAKDETVQAWLKGCDELIESGVATDHIAICPVALRRRLLELLERRAAEPRAPQAYEATLAEVWQSLGQLSPAMVNNDAVNKIVEAAYYAAENALYKAGVLKLVDGRLVVNRQTEPGTFRGIGVTDCVYGNPDCPQCHQSMPGGEALHTDYCPAQNRSEKPA